MLEDITVARPYAKAIFDFAIESESLENWKDMLKLFSNISVNIEMKKFFSDIYTAETLSNIFLIACGNNINIYGKNLIKLLAINKRLKILKDIFICFMQFYNIHYNIINIKLISPIHFNDHQKKIIHFVLEKKFCKKVHLTLKINTCILDGIIIYLDDVIIDDCMYNRLQELSDSLLS